MIVFCEECGARNNIDLDKLGGQPPRCENCKDILRIPETTLQRVARPAATGAHLELRMGESVFELESQQRTSLTLGRQQHNDVEVVDTRVSRSHARIEYRAGKFILIDHSTNGTYVRFDKGEKQGVNLHRDELELAGAGFIALGRKLAPESTKAIHFIVKAA